LLCRGNFTPVLEGDSPIKSGLDLAAALNEALHHERNAGDYD
jgi:hypothetical protein